MTDQGTQLALAETDEEFLREAADRIRVRMSRAGQDIVEIGRDLIAIKDRVGHGNFLPWIEREFGMSDQSAANFMNVARRYGDQIPNGLEFQPAVLYALAAPSTPEEVRTEIAERAAAGETVTAEDVRTLKLESLARGADGSLTPESKKTLAPLIKEIHDENVRGTQGTGNDQWYTPAHVIHDVRAVLGVIDLDPASTEQAQATVQALQWFGKADDGLTRQWHGNVFLNPPYAPPLMGNFADKMIVEIDAGRVKQAIMLTHNYTGTAWFQKLAKKANAICFPKGRIRFVDPNGELASPTQGQAFFYFGTDVPRFVEVFEARGVVGALNGDIHSVAALYELAEPDDAVRVEIETEADTKRLPRMDKLIELIAQPERLIELSDIGAAAERATDEDRILLLAQLAYAKTWINRATRAVEISDQVDDRRMVTTGMMDLLDLFECDGVDPAYRAAFIIANFDRDIAGKIGQFSIPRISRVFKALIVVLKAFHPVQ